MARRPELTPGSCPAVVVGRERLRQGRIPDVRAQRARGWRLLHRQLPSAFPPGFFVKECPDSDEHYEVTE